MSLLLIAEIVRTLRQSKRRLPGILYHQIVARLAKQSGYTTREIESVMPKAEFAARRKKRIATDYEDLPARHYRERELRIDQVSACLILDPSIAKRLPAVGAIELDAVVGYSLHSILMACRAFSTEDATRAIVADIGRAEVLRICEIANEGIAWHWYVEAYAARFLKLERIAAAYFGEIG